MWIIWLVIAALLMAGEVATTGFFLLWFGICAGTLCKPSKASNAVTPAPIPNHSKKKLVVATSPAIYNAAITSQIIHI